MPTILDSNQEYQEQPMTDKERKYVHYLRTMLKDLPKDVMRSLNTLVEEQRGERWTDRQLLVYINQAIGDLNSAPPHTSFTLGTLPDDLQAFIVTGGMIFALIAEGIFQVGEQFSYSDNGISLSINLASGYQSMAQMLLNSWVQQKKDIKTAMRPYAAATKSSPAPVRIRSYAPRMWVYR